MERSWRVALLAGFSAALLSGCLPDPSEAVARAPAEEPSNSAPFISGAPTPTAITGTQWQFVPVAGDADGDVLSFSATGLPRWLGLDTRTGRVSGMPVQRDVGTTATIVITVSDGRHRTSMPAFSITVSSAGGTPPPSGDDPAQNTPPTISGSPPNSVTAGSTYSFQPVAQDPDGLELVFSISNKPAWASFNVATGRLSGTPTNAELGTNSGIVISVTDPSGASATLGPFQITVAAPAASGSATLSWTAPREYTDGSVLPSSDLVAYRIYRGSSVGQLGRIAEVEGNAASFTVVGLAAGTHFFAVTALSAEGVESAPSTTGSKIIQ